MRLQGLSYACFKDRTFIDLAIRCFSKSWDRVEVAGIPSAVSRDLLTVVLWGDVASTSLRLSRFVGSGQESDNTCQRMKMLLG